MGGRIRWGLIAGFLFSLSVTAPAHSQTTSGTTRTGLQCPVAGDVSGCNANDISSVSFVATNIVDDCSNADDTAIVDVVVSWTSSSTNYDLSFAYNALGGSADDGGASCTQTYLDQTFNGPSTRTVRMEFACRDSDNDGTVDVSTIFNWEKNSNDAIGLPASLTSVRVTTPKCQPATVYNLSGLAFPPTITGPSGGPGAANSAISVAENQTAVTQFTANEAGTWALSGADATLFSIATDGTVTFNAPPDFEAPGDTGGTAGDNIYVVDVEITDASGNTATQTLSVTVTDVAEGGDTTPPTITGPSGGPGAANSAISVAENQTAVTQFTANEAGTWALSGADATLFSIATDGTVTFNAPPDFEAPGDTGGTAGDNIYVVDVEITDASGNTATQTLSVTVTDVADADAISTAITEVIAEDAIRLSRSRLDARHRMTGAARDRLVAFARKTDDCTAVEENDGRSAIEVLEFCEDLASRRSLPFDIDGVARLDGESFLLDGAFSEQSHVAGYNRLVFGDFTIHGYDGDITTVTLSANIAWERYQSTRALTGFTIGIDLSSTEIHDDFSGNSSGYAVSAGVYGVRRLSEDLFVEGFLAFGIGHNEIDLNDSLQVITGNYDSQFVELGGSFSGHFANESFEVWPEIEADYSAIWLDGDNLMSTLGGGTPLALTVDRVWTASLRFKAEFRFPLVSDDPEMSRSHFFVEPEFGCEYYKTLNTESECGGGLRLGILSASLDQRTRVEASAQYKWYGGAYRNSLQVQLLHSW